MRRFALMLLILLGVRAPAAEPVVRVVLWFDTEDYLLPASDDAALRVARFLTGEDIRATFKVVGEKARALERRGRADVIDALKAHEIGYHSNYHSVQPTPAQYLEPLGWDEGVSEFLRRETPGAEDVARVFGRRPTCYGQPGSSWGPHAFAAMRKWGMSSYLDSGRHVKLDGKPHYYGGLLTLYKLDHTFRADLQDPDGLRKAEDRFAAARQQLTAEGGCVISIVYHPCEFVHREFWDGVNFRLGANPPREMWQAPPQQSADESRQKYEMFEAFVRHIKRHPRVTFSTASELAEVYRDAAKGKAFTTAEVREIAAAAAGGDVMFQRRGGVTLSPSEVLLLLTTWLKDRPKSVKLSSTPWGPTTPVTAMSAAVECDGSQWARATADVNEYLLRHDRVPPAVWLGSTAVAPEAYLSALAEVVRDTIDGKPPPDHVRVKPVRFAAGDYVADDGPGLWKWVIFPEGFRAPQLMAQARRQAWTLKPAVARE